MNFVYDLEGPNTESYGIEVTALRFGQSPVVITAASLPEGLRKDEIHQGGTNTIACTVEENHSFILRE